jgi:hypothetical protein
MPQIGQRYVGTELRDRLLLAVLPFAPATDD